MRYHSWLGNRAENEVYPPPELSGVPIIAGTSLTLWAALYHR